MEIKSKSQFRRITAQLVAKLDKAEALAASRLKSLDAWKEAAKEKRWRLILCTEAAAKRKELLRRVAKLVDPVAHEPGECEDCDLMREVMEELGDECSKTETG